MEQLECCYDPADLARLKRSDLVALVQRQLDKWPTQTLGKFRPQKTNMDIMKTALTSANSQFTNINLQNGRLHQLSTISGSLFLGLLLPDLRRGQPPGSSFSFDRGVKLNGKREGEIGWSCRERVISGNIWSQLMCDICQASQTKRLKIPFINCFNRLKTETVGALLSEYRPILLLVEDTRSIGEKVSHRVRVSVINPENAATGEWQASSQEIVDELQASIAAFRGPVRIGISDPGNPGYTIFLATITGPEYQANDAPSSPILVDVPQSGTLKLTGAAKRLQSESLTDTKGELSTSTQTLTEKELTEKAQSTAGFDEFKLNQNRHLSNSERVRYWRFAAAFSTTYYKAQWPCGIELSGGKSVKKNVIKAALGMETTMLTQALNMAKIVGIYYDGPHRSSEVVERIDSGPDSAGSEALANFLVQWEKDHPLSTISL
ncbi:hypothetical protein DFH07DRAFT_784344 [Mycena maculata]|uniref:Uncharacterized protein n=1 Tax=Mycena maculata TaxID=230809 RepID=A0AAD7HIE8_9AGAR|nr:hypothetical protein DFH07DRAFT_784344 [Mycena maculata]